MRNVGFSVAQSHGPNETLQLDWFPRKSFTNKGGLGDHAFPGFALTLAGLDDLEHLIFGNAADFGEGNGVFGSFVFAFLLDSGGEGLGGVLLLSVEEVGGEGGIWGGSGGLLDIALVVCLELLLQLNLFGVSPLVEDLGL
jgi:hypothetical protein